MYLALLLLLTMYVTDSVAQKEQTCVYIQYSSATRYVTCMHQGLMCYMQVAREFHMSNIIAVWVATHTNK